MKIKHYLLTALILAVLVLQAQRSKSSERYFKTPEQRRMERNQRIEREKADLGKRNQIRTILSDRSLTQRERFKRLQDLRNSQRNVSRRTADIFSRPTQGIHHTWVGNNWEYDYTTSYTYDEFGNINFKYIVDSVSNDTQDIIRTLYDSNKNLVSETIYTKTSNGYKETSKDSFVYHPVHADFEVQSLFYSDNGSGLELDWGNKVEFESQNNLITKKITKYFDGSQWVTDYEEVYTYDVNGRLKTVEYDDDKTEFFYAGNQFYPNKIIISEYDGVSYEELEMYDSIQFQGFNKTMAEYEIFDYDLEEDAKMINYIESYNYGMGWEKDYKTEISWGAVNVETGYSWSGAWINDSRRTFLSTDSFEFSMSEEYDLDDMIWVPTYRDSSFYDRFYDLGSINEEYNTSIQSWEISWQRRYVKEINSNGDLVSLTEKVWNYSNRILENNSKEIFTAWQEFEIEDPASVANIGLENKFVLYPNPVKNQLNIRSLLEKPYGLTIRDLSGRVVIQSNRSQEVETVETSDLQQGIYMIFIQNENNETSVFKIVKY